MYGVGQLDTIHFWCGKQYPSVSHVFDYITLIFLLKPIYYGVVCLHTVSFVQTVCEMHIQFMCDNTAGRVAKNEEILEKRWFGVRFGSNSAM